ncbi:uncharacterized protein LOC111363748 [Spodoptera litura]|uniref:Uncharacterized protein LOC111363748 n=1 Tax=Spodoptera litura TaxID=69820 RepID=A0A9J7EVN1_SPOLT|nr:uncharacterized protein LOC111363748 [Spodoptera litura]
MSVKIEEILMKVKVDTSEGVNRLGLLEDAYLKLLKAQKEAKTYTEQRSVFDAMGIVKEQIDKQREALGLQGLTLTQLKRLQAEYAQQWSKTYTEGSEKWKEARQNYDLVGERIKAVTRNTKDLEIQNLEMLEGLRLNAQQFGIESLSVTQLEKLSKHLYDTMIKGAGAGQIENHALYQEYLNINRVMTSTKEKFNAVKVVENAYNDELKQTVKELGIEALSLDRLKDYHNLLQKEIGQTINLEDAHGRSLVDNYQRVGSLIDSKKKQIEGTQPLLSQIFGSIPTAIAGGFGGGLAALGLDSIGSIPAKIANVTRAVGELDDVNSDLEISLGKTDAQVKALNSDLGDIDTRTKVSELKQLAIVAGDLNEVDVEGFVEQMDKAQIVFSRDFSNAEELASTFGSLLELFPESRKMPIVEFVDAYGSAIKKLNDDGPATTKGIIEFTQRMGQLPDAIKPAASETLGLAAIFEEAKLTAEISAGGLSNVLLTASQNSALFAKQLKMSRAEVKELINTNPNEFLIKLGESFKGASGTELSEKLKTLKINSNEQVKVIGVLTDNLDKLKQKQDLASKSVAEATRLDEVFNEKNTNKAATIEKASKVWTGWMNSLSSGLTNVFIPLLENLVSYNAEIKAINSNSDELQKKTDVTIKKLTPLVAKYEDLKEQQNLSARQQRELNTVMQDISTIVPTAITQYDNYGRAISLNIGILKDYLEQQKKVQDTIKNSRSDELLNQIKNSKNTIDALKNDIEYTKNHPQAGTERYKAHLRDLNKQLQGEVFSILNAKRRIRELNTIEKIQATTEEEDPKKKHIETEEEKAARLAKEEKLRIEAQKFIQENTKKEIDLRSKLIYEADVASVNEEQKKVLEAERRAEENLNKIRQQFTDENGLVIEHDKQSLLQRNRIATEETEIERTLRKEVLDIRTKSAQEREAQLKEQILKTKELADKGAMDELNAQLNIANRKGKTQEAYILQRQIIQTQGLLTLDGIEKRYQEELIKLKDNKEAQKLLTQNYETEKLNQKKATNSALDELEEQHNLATNQRIRNTEIERQRLAVQKLETEGKNPLQAQLVLLNSEMQQELNVAGITEQEKANIREKYRQQETALIHAHNIQLGEAIVNGYGQAFGAIAGLMQTNLNNRVQKESESYQKNLESLENEKNKKLITDAEYTKKKKALDDKHKAEERKFKKEQFEITRAENLSRATMETALSILRASPDPIRMTFAGIIGGAQIANILATEAPAYAQGGMIETGVKDKGPGFLIRVNEKGKEYIVPNWQLQDPVVANLVDFIDKRRVNKVSGFEEGGYSSAQKGSFIAGSEKIINSPNELKALLVQLNTTLEQLPSAIEKANLIIDFNNEHAYELQKKLNENQQTQKSALQ